MSSTYLDIGSVLTNLMRQANMSEAKLARATHIPRATINRLVSGRTPDPRASTLNAIAKYFEISVDQLLGLQPLHPIQPSHAINAFATQIIPLLEWDDVINLRHAHLSHFASRRRSIHLHDFPAVQPCFAVEVTGDAMWPQFQEGSLLIIAQQAQAENRDFVIAYLGNTNTVVFRQFFKEGHGGFKE